MHVCRFLTWHALRVLCMCDHFIASGCRICSADQSCWNLPKRALSKLPFMLAWICMLTKSAHSTAYRHYIGGGPPPATGKAPAPGTPLDSRTTAHRHTHIHSHSGQTTGAGQEECVNSRTFFSSAHLRGGLPDNCLLHEPDDETARHSTHE